MHPSDLPLTQQQSQLQISGGGFNFFVFSCWFMWRWSNLTNIFFELDWFNHQVVNYNFPLEKLRFCPIIWLMEKNQTTTWDSLKNPVNNGLVVISRIFSFHPENWGKMNPFWRAYFSSGWCNHRSGISYLSTTWFLNHQQKVSECWEVCFEGESRTPGCPIAPMGRSTFSFQVTCIDCTLGAAIFEAGKWGFKVGRCINSPEISKKCMENGW